MKAVERVYVIGRKYEDGRTVYFSRGFPPRDVESVSEAEPFEDRRVAELFVRMANGLAWASYFVEEVEL